MLDDLQMPGAVIDTLKAAKDSPEVNYRYASDPLRSCGMCIHFKPPGGCELVMGVIRSVDSCNLFEPKPYGGRLQVQYIPEESPSNLVYPGARQREDEPVAPEKVQAEVKPATVQAEFVGHAGRPDLTPSKKPSLVQAEVSEGFGPQQPKSKNLADQNFQKNEAQEASKKQRKWLKTAIRSGGKFIGRGGSHKAVQATGVTF